MKTISKAVVHQVETTPDGRGRFTVSFPSTPKNIEAFRELYSAMVRIRELDLAFDSGAGESEAMGDGRFWWSKNVSELVIEGDVLARAQRDVMLTGNAVLQVAADGTVRNVEPSEVEWKDLRNAKRVDLEPLPEVLAIDPWGRRHK